MMTRAKFLIIDTETTGLPPRAAKGAPPIPADDPRQPRLASFAMIVADEAARAIQSAKYYIRPDGWSIDGTEAAAVNGLSDAFLAVNGLPVEGILKDYSHRIEAQGLIVVAHNAVFDTKIMRGELRRAGMPDLFEQTRNICTMKALKPYIAEGLHSSGYGRVSLANACAFFGIAQDQAHDAMSDAENCRAILEILIRDGRCPEPGITLAQTRQPDGNAAPTKSAGAKRAAPRKRAAAEADTF